MTTWRYVGSCADGEPFALAGTDVWSVAWTPCQGGKATVRDPLYQQRFEFPVYDLPTRAGPLRFAAGEFSNGIWGFYRPEPEP